MPHLNDFRAGRSNESLAEYVLSKFSFIAKPPNNLDDVGTDFFCTIYEKVNTQLIPKNTFAIQVKSNKDDIDITKKLDYFDGFELPYFVAVVNEGKIEIFSGEGICNFLTKYGKPTDKKVEIKLEENVEQPYKIYEEFKSSYVIKFPKRLELDINFDYDISSEKINEFSKLCKIIQFNLSSRQVNEYVYHRFKDDWVDIYAGIGSIKTFKDNFFKRLAEVFFNLEWLSDKPDLKDFSQTLEEFEVYEKVYDEILRLYKIVPEYLIKRFESTKEKIFKIILESPSLRKSTPTKT